MFHNSYDGKRKVYYACLQTPFFETINNKSLLNIIHFAL